MRHIVRSTEPNSFTTWKSRASPDWHPTWDNFQRPEKTDVLNALLRDQGFVCCYCERRISIKHAEEAHKESHIEHLQPRSLSPGLSLDFSNLLASFQAGQEEQPRQIPSHCGHLKGDKLLQVHPLIPDCRAYFTFDTQGYIRPTNDPSKSAAAKQTIETLGLDIPKLVARRREAIDAALSMFEEGFSDAEINQFLQALDAKNAAGEHTPFASAVIQALAPYMP